MGLATARDELPPRSNGLAPLGMASMASTSSLKLAMPSVVGLGLRDALFVLENKGLKVEVDGYGKVARQSLRAGTVIQGQTVKLTMQ